ncbi:GtrA family protein [Krasilnikovia sp. MM14-A1259]|uniref:GtrA family protein n=1 Tax=Krasilnikovia sp. MM14-A1259 TaxID=3373539 RepID=UPI00399CCA37
MKAVSRPALVWLTRIGSKHHEAAKFFMVGGVCFLVTTCINYSLKLSVLHKKPLTALAIATIFSTILSYLLNRQWSFRTRGGRKRHHEAALFFSLSAVGIALNLIPLGVSRYLLLLRVPDVSRSVQEVADFVSGIVLGTLIAMCFRLWAFRRFVFPHPHDQPHRLKRPSKPGPHSRIVQHEPSSTGQRPGAPKAPRG